MSGPFSRCFHFKYCIASRLLLSDQMILVDWYKLNAVWLTPLYCAVIDMSVTIEMPFILRRKKRAIRMMATVVLLFAACWAPFHLVSLLLDYGNTKFLVPFPPAYCCQSPCFFLPLTGNKKNILLHVCLSASCCLSCESIVNILTSDSLIFPSPSPLPQHIRGQHIIPVNHRHEIYFYPSSHTYQYGNYFEFGVVLDSIHRLLSLHLQTSGNKTALYSLTK